MHCFVQVLCVLPVVACVVGWQFVAVVMLECSCELSGRGFAACAVRTVRADVKAQHRKTAQPRDKTCWL